MFAFRLAPVMIFFHIAAVAMRPVGLTDLVEVVICREVTV